MVMVMVMSVERVWLRKIRKPFGAQRYENLLDLKDTKTYWIQKIRKPLGARRYKNLLDQNSKFPPFWYGSTARQTDICEREHLLRGHLYM